MTLSECHVMCVVTTSCSVPAVLELARIIALCVLIERSIKQSVCAAMPKPQSSGALAPVLQVQLAITRYSFITCLQLQSYLLFPVGAITSCRWFRDWQNSSPPATLFGCCTTLANRYRRTHRRGQGGTAPCQRGIAGVPKRCLPAEAWYQRLRTPLPGHPPACPHPLLPMHSCSEVRLCIALLSPCPLCLTATCEAAMLSIMSHMDIPCSSSHLSSQKDKRHQSMRLSPCMVKCYSCTCIQKQQHAVVYAVSHAAAFC